MIKTCVAISAAALIMLILGIIAAHSKDKSGNYSLPDDLPDNKTLPNSPTKISLQQDDLDLPIALAVSTVVVLLCACFIYARRNLQNTLPSYRNMVTAAVSPVTVGNDLLEVVTTLHQQQPVEYDVVAKSAQKCSN